MQKTDYTQDIYIPQRLSKMGLQWGSSSVTYKLPKSLGFG